MTVIESVANALTEYDVAKHGEPVASYDEYMEMAATTVSAYEEYTTRPRPKAHFVEGLQFL